MMMDGPSKPPPLFDLSDWRLGEPPCSVGNVPSACIADGCCAPRCAAAERKALLDSSILKAVYESRRHR